MTERGGRDEEQGRRKPSIKSVSGFRSGQGLGPQRVFKSGKIRDGLRRLLLVAKIKARVLGIYKRCHKVKFLTV